MFITLWEWDNLTGTVFIGSYFIKSNIHLFKIAIGILEKGMKYVQSLQERHQNDVSDVGLVSLLLTLNIFYTFF